MDIWYTIKSPNPQHEMSLDLISYLHNVLFGVLRIVIPCIMVQYVSEATIATDGSLGPAAQTLTADNGAYTIVQDLGARSGDNLFHSFDRFNLDEGESATFTGAADIRTVISRVTGGTASTIDGVLRSTIGSADLYFLNPAGVLFGPNATLDLPGAFHFSTADYIRLGADDVFYNDPLESSVLSTAAPTAFGFLEVPQAGIQVDGATLAVAEGQTLSLVGGSVDVIAGAQLEAAAGQVNLISAASSGEAVWLTDNEGLDGSRLSALGTVSVKGASAVNVDGTGGGRIFIRGGQVVIEDSVLSARTEGNNDGKGVDIEAQSDVSLVSSTIDTRTDAAGRAGDVTIAADRIIFDGRPDGRPVEIFTASLVDLTNPTLSVELNIGHTNNSLNAYLQKRSAGTFITLFEDLNPGTIGHNFSGTVLRDDAAISISQGESPFSGVYQPQQPFSEFEGVAPNGLWELIFFDEKGFEDAGRLSSWSLSVNDKVFEATEDKLIQYDGVVVSPVTVTLEVAPAGSIALQANLLDAFGAVVLDAFATEGRAGAINVPTSTTVTLDDFDATIQTNGSIVSKGVGRIVLDGTLIPANNGHALSGPEYSIDSAYGQIRGNNLFHSFRDFLIYEDETATFLGPMDGTISNILARVTGDRLTRIYGKLDSNISGAKLYLINPNGFVFGEEASLDLAGSFHVSTADYLNLTSGGAFQVAGSFGTLDSLNDGEPSAYGFLNDSVGAIIINGSALLLPQQETFSLVGGDFELYGGGLTAHSGQINLLSVGSAGLATINDDDAGFDTSDFSTFGNVLLDAKMYNNGDIDSVAELNVSSGSSSSGNVGGGMFVRAGNLTLKNNARLDAETDSGTVGAFGRTIDIDVKDHLQLFSAGRILVGTKSAANAGNIIIQANNLTLDGAGSNTPVRIASRASQFSSVGNGGNVDITVNDHLHLLNGAQITVSTSSSGNGGNAIIQTNTLTIDGTHLQDSSIPTGIFSTVNDNNNPQPGNGGTLDIRVNSDLHLFNNGRISISTKTAGDAGKVLISSKNVHLKDDGIILGNTFSQGAGGTIRIDVQDTLTMSDARIASQTTSSGNAGQIFISGTSTAKTMHLMNGAKITATTSGSGMAGQISLSAFTNILLEGDETQITSASNSNTLPVDDTGDAGIIVVEATGNIELKDRAAIATYSQQSNAGSVRIHADGQLYLNNSTIDIKAGQGVTANGLQPSNRFRLDNPTEGASLTTFLSEFAFPELSMTSIGDLSIVANSVVNAKSGFLGGAVSLKSIEGCVRIDDSTVTLESDQFGLNLSNLFDPSSGTLDVGAFRKDYPRLFPQLSLEAASCIEVVDSTLTTDAGLSAQAATRRSSASDPVFGFGGSINLKVPQGSAQQLIALDGSELRAESNTMGGNISVHGYTYVVNHADIIARAQSVGGNYTIDVTNWLQSVDSSIDLSGAQAGQVISDTTFVDLSAALAKLSLDFLSANRFSGASCDLYYAQAQSSFIVQPARLDGLNVEDYMPSAPPAYLHELEYISEIADEADEAYWKDLLDLDLGCSDCI